MKILAVEDIEQNRHLLRKLLEGYGYSVVVARNGVEALEGARESPPDMVITDTLMPRMDGFQLCRTLKSDEKLKTIPVLFYSATYTDKKSRELAFEIGAAEYIVKPIEPDKFIKIIKGTFEKHERGELKPIEKPLEEPVYMELYNERLIQKLEEKTLGTGLGLHLTKKIMKNVFNGNIMVESQYGRGGTFTLIIPLGAVVR
ncbi:MAG: response regulator [Euryarchaeota archaeon]|nr:response regulator [Euryarchaeota archaeon]